MVRNDLAQNAQKFWLIAFFENMRISRKLVLAVLFAFIPVLGANIYTLVNIRQSNVAIDRVSDIRLPAYVILSEISLDVSRSISAFYGFIITGRPVFRERRASGWKLMAKTIENYEGLFGSEGLGQHKAEWDRIKGLLEKLRQVQEQQEARIASGELAGPKLIEALDKEMVPVARGVMDALRGNPTQREKSSDGFSGDNSRMLVRDVREIEANMLSIERIVILFSLMAVVALLLGGWMLGKLVSGPLERMVGATNNIAHGSFDVEIPSQGRKDELGQMAGALSVFRDGLIANQMHTIEEERTRALAKSRQNRIEAAISQFEVAAEGVVQSISASASLLNNSAQNLTQSARGASSESGQVLAAAELARQNVTGLASAGDELYQVARSVELQLENSTEAAKAAVTRVREADQQIVELSRAASTIGDVVNLINGLAGQTNLLALNATIEAARAGDAGRGFAVVAQEVKALAAQTSSATDEIGAVVQHIQGVTRQTVEAIRQIDVAIAQIDKSTADIAGSVSEQVRATHQIAVGAQQAADGTDVVSRSIAEVDAVAGSTALAAGDVLASADDLARQAATMRDEMRRFLDTVRAA